MIPGCSRSRASESRSPVHCGSMRNCPGAGSMALSAVRSVGAMDHCQSRLLLDQGVQGVAPDHDLIVSI
jgi:hypothetical protein